MTQVRIATSDRPRRRIGDAGRLHCRTHRVAHKHPHRAYGHQGGVIAMTRQLAAEGAAHHIRANCLCPEMIRTPGSEENLLAADHPMRSIAGAIPLGRIGTPEDAARWAFFLASDESSDVTGPNLVIDGGWSAVLPGAAA